MAICVVKEEDGRNEEQALERVSSEEGGRWTRNACFGMVAWL
jgi:hypothetical protein